MGPGKAERLSKNTGALSQREGEVGARLQAQGKLAGPYWKEGKGGGIGATKQDSCRSGFTISTALWRARQQFPVTVDQERQNSTSPALLKTVVGDLRLKQDNQWPTSTFCPFFFGILFLGYR